MKRSAPLSGTRHCGDYEILRKLGQGGVGEVHLARHSSLRRFVALKLLSPQLANVPGAVDRFVREAQAASKGTLQDPRSDLEGADAETLRILDALLAAEGTTLLQAHVEAPLPLQCSTARLDGRQVLTAAVEALVGPSKPLQDPGVPQ